jgi:hypothetical protein
MDSKVTVETKAETPPPAVVQVHEGRFHFLKTLCAVYLSRKFVVTMTFGWLVYAIYWSATKCIYTFENPDQLRAFTTVFQTSMGVFGSIALGYLGFSRTSSNLSSYISPSTSNRRWKSDPEDR